MKHIINILEFLILFILVICCISYLMLICKFTLIYYDKAYLYALSVLIIFIGIFELLFRVSIAKIVKKYPKMDAFACIFIVLFLVSVGAYFKIDKIHNIFSTDISEEKVATVWYYRNMEYGQIYRFDVYNDRKVEFQYAYLPKNFSEFNVNIMEVAKQNMIVPLNKTTDGYRFISKYKYNRLISCFQLLKDEQCLDGNELQSKCSNDEFKTYIHYNGVLHNISDVYNSDLTKDIVLSLYKCISFDSPLNLTGWYELVDYEKTKSKILFLKIFKYCIFSELVVLTLFVIFSAFYKYMIFKKTEV